mgnify:CR=1 FL=1
MPLQESAPQNFLPITVAEVKAYAKELQGAGP